MPIWGVRTPYQRRVWNGTGTTSGVKGEKEAFAEVEKLVLGHHKVNPRKVKDFQISFRARTATFTDPSTGLRKEVDLLSIPEVQSALNKYLDITPGARADMRYAQVYANCKGDQHGSKTLQRQTVALQKLPKEITNVPRVLAMQPSKEARVLIDRRMHFAKYFLGKWKEKLDERSKKKQEELKSPTLSDLQGTKLRKELNELKTLSGKLEEVDLYALSQALGFYPVGRVDQITLDQYAEALEKAVLKDIKPKKWKGLRNADHSPADKTYAQDVAGMLYLERRSYFNYCNKTFGNGETKSEHVSDIFLREAIQFAGMSGEYTAEGFKTSVLLQGMSDELKKEIEGDLNAVGALASHAMPGVDLSQYEDPAFPDGTSDAKKADLTMKKMEEAHKAHEERVKKDLKVEDLPLPSEPGVLPSVLSSGLSNVLSVAKTAVPLAAAGGAFVAAGAFGLVNPWKVAEVGQAIIQHPAGVIGSLTFLDSLRHHVMSYIAPKVRDKETAIVSRKPNYRNMALMSGAALVTAFAGIAMYNAVNDDHEDDSFFEQAGEYSWWAAQMAAQTVDYVWHHSFLQLTSSPWRIPFTNRSWGGSIPMMMAIQLAGSVSNKLPIIGKVTKPAFRALGYVARASGLAPLAGGIVSKGIEYGGWGINEGIEYGRSGISKGMEIGGLSFQSAVGKVKQFATAAFETYKIFASRRGPLTIL